MQLWEVLLIGFAVSMDAVAVGMTNGISEPSMRIGRAALIAGVYAVFQFLMPVLGYYGSSVFAELVEAIAPWLAFALLTFIGGKMIVDFVRERRRAEAPSATVKRLTAGKLLAQGVATSIDALAVGVTMLAAERTVGLPFHVVLCSLCIGGITLALSFAAVLLGRKIGNRFADKAELLGGIILVVIGIKILIEGLL